MNYPIHIDTIRKELSSLYFTQPPIQLLHRIKTILCNEEEGQLTINEIDVKFSNLIQPLYVMKELDWWL